MPKQALKGLKDSSKIKSPKNKIASKSYHEHYGRLLAEEKISEFKSAQYGRIAVSDKFLTTTTLPKLEGYTNLQRAEIVKKGMELYDQNELVRPIINLIATAIFPSGSPEINGKRQDLVDITNKIIDFNDLNFHELAREAEIAGDTFLWFDRLDKEKTRIYSLDARVTNSVLDGGDIRKLAGYSVQPQPTGTNKLGSGSQKPQLLPSRVQHLKFNSTTTSQYGRSSLRHVIYWLNVLDELFEKNWLRGAQYYGNPLLAIIGVPGTYMDRIKTMIESQTQRAGRNWVLPPDTDVKVPSLALEYPIGEIINWVFRLISISTEIPITLLGTADAGSRGSAFFANPRLDLAIKPRREVWRIGLRRFFIKIFKANGIISDEEELARKDFDISFQPIFEKSLSDLADVVAIYRQNRMMSKKTALEMLGIDSVEELERMEAEPKEDFMQNPLNAAGFPVGNGDNKQKLDKNGKPIKPAKDNKDDDDD